MAVNKEDAWCPIQTLKNMFGMMEKTQRGKISRQKVLGAT